jgi:hypothetical protein
METAVINFSTFPVRYHTHTIVHPYNRSVFADVAFFNEEIFSFRQGFDNQLFVVGPVIGISDAFNSSLTELRGVSD